MCSSFTMMFWFKNPWAKHTSADVFLDAAKHTWAAKKRDRYDKLMHCRYWVDTIFTRVYVCKNTGTLDTHHQPFCHWSVNCVAENLRSLDGYFCCMMALGEDHLLTGREMVGIWYPDDLGKVLSKPGILAHDMLETRPCSGQTIKTDRASLYHRRVT